MQNYYPELPKLPYQKTTVNMNDVVAYLKTVSESTVVKIAAYTIFRMESGGGQHGINFNFCGIQADSGRWGSDLDKYIAGVVEKVENGTSKTRLFLSFKDFTGSIQFLLDRVLFRGIYVGGYAAKIAKMHISNPHDWAIAYYREWVTGEVGATPDNDTLNTLISIYGNGVKLLS